VSGAATVGGREQPRLFLGLVLADDVKRVLAAWQRSAFGGVPDVRPVRRDNLHVTLAFLGRTPAERVGAVADALRAAAAGVERPLVLSLERYRETRSVGMLVLADEGGRTTRLAGDLHGRLEAAGVYRPERRPWLPHLTVVRFRRPPRLSPSLPRLGAISPSEAAVYHSLLRPTGAEYEIVESVALGGGSG
jgi:RNA 2',3'-cyclic 3'-phosphodiesterase